MKASNRVFYILTAVFGAALLALHPYAKEKLPSTKKAGLPDSLEAAMSLNGRYPPEFELDLLDGGKFKLSDHIGKEVIVLNFFATWCGPCNKEIPELLNFSQRHSADPVLLVGVDSDESADRVRQFVSQHMINYPVGIDKGDYLSKLFRVHGLPTTVVIGADGKVDFFEVGQVVRADLTLEPAIKQGLAAIRAGAGIKKEAFLAVQNTVSMVQPPDNFNDGDKDKKEALTGRALAIANTMICPCGCQDKVANCKCDTAKKIRKKLAGMDMKGKTNAQVIKDLNNEFCVKGSDD